MLNSRTTTLYTITTGLAIARRYHRINLGRQSLVSANSEPFPNHLVLVVVPELHYAPSQHDRVSVAYENIGLYEKLSSYWVI